LGLAPAPASALRTSALARGSAPGRGGFHLLQLGPSEALDAVGTVELDPVPPLLPVYHGAWAGVREFGCVAGGSSKGKDMW